MPTETALSDSLRIEPAASPPRIQRGASSPAWWLWPHLLSLDAPLVAIGWQQWIASVAGTPLAWFDGVILGLAVWMIYLADRLIDAARATPAELETARHVFYREHRLPMTLLLAAVVLVLTVLSPLVLPRAQFAGGLLLLAAAAAYFRFIHRRRRYRSRVVPKEAIVGAMFAIGTGFFIGCAGAGRLPASFFVQEVLFAGVCFLNCALITRWEQTVQDRADASSLFNAFPALVPRLGAGCLVVAVLAVAAAGRECGPVAIAAMGLWALERSRARLSPTALRVLADVVLLGPWVWLAVR